MGGCDKQRKEGETGKQGQSQTQTDKCSSREGKREERGRGTQREAGRVRSRGVV